MSAYMFWGWVVGLSYQNISTLGFLMLRIWLLIFLCYVRMPITLQELYIIHWFSFSHSLWKFSLCFHVHRFLGHEQLPCLPILSYMFILLLGYKELRLYHWDENGCNSFLKQVLVPSSCLVLTLRSLVFLLLTLFFVIEVFSCFPLWTMIFVFANMFLRYLETWVVVAGVVVLVTFFARKHAYWNW